MTESPPKAGVIGWPVEHSKSPIIHGHWLAEHGLPGDYVHIPISPADFASRLKGLEAEGFVGANVTIPHKENALHLADKASDRAVAIGAANTLVFKDGQIFADNTDAEGFLNNLRAGAPDWNPAAGLALILGAGGAARAIVYALKSAGVADIMISNRTQSRADALAQEFGVSTVPWPDISTATKKAMTVVNTTSLGMTGQPPLEIMLEGTQDTLVTDIVYAPLETALLAQARDRGMAAVDGLGMLLHQAVPGFEAWFGVRPTVTPELRKKVLA
ncbi:MAG: shikimate dehydrogenase [Pseudomonadota bacterium]